jgi:predicted dehydrogenase
MDYDKSVIIIGYGYWGKKVTNEYLKLVEADQIKNIYIYETNQDLLKFKDQRLKIVTSVKQIPSSVHFAHVCTPNNSHFEVTKQLLEGGCSVMVEKPLSEHSQEAEKLLEIAENNSVGLSVGMVYRYSQAVEKSKHLISEKIGATRFISASWLHNIDIPNIRRVMMERDVVWDIFIHLLDIINYIFNEWPSFEHVSGMSNSKGHNHTFVAIGQMRKANIVIKSSFVSHFKERKIKIIGEKADLILDILNNVVTVGTDENLTKFYFYDNPLYSEILAFVNSGNNNNLSNTGIIGLKETKIIETLLQKQISLRAGVGGNL